jgi:hypothetical protein
MNMSELLSYYGNSLHVLYIHHSVKCYSFYDQKNPKGKTIQIFGLRPD